MHQNPAELAAAIAGLRGARFVRVGRTLNMVEVGLMRGGEELALHVQCPFRIVQRSKVVLGSTDHRYPLPGHGDRAAAFDQYQTQFDRVAELLTGCSATVCRCTAGRSSRTRWANARGG
jgi:hypothetical protein